MKNNVKKYYVVLSLIVLCLTTLTSTHETTSTSTFVQEINVETMNKLHYVKALEDYNKSCEKGCIPILDFYNPNWGLDVETIFSNWGRKCEF